MAFFNIGKSEKKQHSTSKRELRILSDSTSFGFKEAYRALRTNLNYVIESGHVGHVIMVTSSVPSEAKSNVSVNLCISYSQEHKKVLLVDCDLRKGTLHRYLGVSRRQDGIVEYLNNTVKDWRNCIVHLNEYGIDFMPSGMIVDNTTELLGGPKTGYLFNELSNAYDMVICDTPPVNAVADTSVLSKYIGNTQDRFHASQLLVKISPEDMMSYRGVSEYSMDFVDVCLSTPIIIIITTMDPIMGMVQIHPSKTVINSQVLES